LETAEPAAPAGNRATENAQSPTVAAQATLFSSFWSALLLEYGSTLSWAANSRLNDDIFSTCEAFESSLGSAVEVTDVLTFSTS
jgi:hypothetical protein